ncbi:integral membrane sensor hybrid histidine kinase [Solidesulfovibrio fructosivorans JJ]]|uniref:histidine kinase n=1 Tax=Solidesulfovibrio fructosivorans JJ] TaxID=596151 RepID=E1JZS2_SOLFR|nr:response regulator [Solidesulfovibrio fructosivorans]EFL50102.1 integral membrane sensor hybrid histidine kinase [Solidesulfovibrio fructosivorans JJ]]
MQKKTSWIKILAGPLLLISIEAVLAFLAASGFVVPTPVLFLSLAIVLSAYLGGFAAGALSVGITFLFLLYYWSKPGQFLAYTPRDISRITIFLMTMPAMVFLVGMLEKKNRIKLFELKEKTKELEESKERLQRAELVAETGNWEVALSDGTLSTSEGARRIYGMDPNRHYTLREVQHIPLPQYRPMLDAALTDLVGRRIPYNVTFKIRRPQDGAVIDINSRASYDSTDNKIFGTIQDVTAQKQIEADLIESRQRAELANSAKTEFLANMSHEIRTPLNGILGMLQALEDTAPSAEQQRFIGAAIRASRRLAQLLNDILDLSRIEAGKIRITPGPFKLSELVASIEELFSYSARKKGLSLSFSVASGIPNDLLGDAVRIRQILFNLIGNAIKFTNQGSVSLTIEPIRVEEQRIRLLFTVADTGIGIPETLMAHICEPFTQARPDTLPPTQGVGLGLSIVKKLTRLMNGEVTLESREGHGTTVSLSLPLELPQQPETAVTRDAPRPVEIPAPGLRILLAEDDQISAIACRHLLEHMGHVVVTAADGRQALDLFAKENFDLVFMDIQMPTLDGVEATREMRNRDAYADKADTPIIAMTAYAMDGDAQRFLDAGMNGYIAKPVEKATLRETIARVMREAGSGHRRPSPATEEPQP